MTDIIRPDPKDEQDIDIGKKVTPKKVGGANYVPPQINSGLNDLLETGAKGFQKHLEALMGRYLPQGYLKNPSDIVPVYMLTQVNPTSTVYGDYTLKQKIGGISAIEIGFLEYILGLDKQTLEGMDKAHLKELTKSLPEANINITDIPPVLSAPILALTSPTLGRPLIGAAAYLAEADGREVPIYNMKNHSDSYVLETLERITLSVTDIKTARDKFGVPNEMYIAALGAINYAKEKYLEEWDS